MRRSRLAAGIRDSRSESYRKVPEAAEPSLGCLGPACLGGAESILSPMSARRGRGKAASSWLEHVPCRADNRPL